MRSRLHLSIFRALVATGVLCLALTGYTLNRMFLACEAWLIPWMGRA